MILMLDHTKTISVYILLLYLYRPPEPDHQYKESIEICITFSQTANISTLDSSCQQSILNSMLYNSKKEPELDIFNSGNLHINNRNNRTYFDMSVSLNWLQCNNHL